MRCAVRIAVLLAACLGSPARSGDQPDPSEPKPDGPHGWRSLFNGRDLSGWQHIGPGRFQVIDGQLRTEGGMGLLWFTREKFGDCVIRVVYKPSSAGANSGVFVRIADKPKSEWFAVHHGYEVQICDAADVYHCTGAVYSLSKATAHPGKAGRWNTMEITLQGELIRVTVNAVPVTRFEPSQAVPMRVEDYEPDREPRRPTMGYIGLQNHDTDSHVCFKEISVRPL